jgi:hypothetical protein
MCTAGEWPAGATRSLQNEIEKALRTAANGNGVHSDRKRFFASPVYRQWQKNKAGFRCGFGNRQQRDHPARRPSIAHKDSGLPGGTIAKSIVRQRMHGYNGFAPSRRSSADANW